MTTYSKHATFYKDMLEKVYFRSCPFIKWMAEESTSQSLQDKQESQHKIWMMHHILSYTPWIGGTEVYIICLVYCLECDCNVILHLPVIYI